MATFSQGFLSNLGSPAMTKSLFDLGTAIGSVPAQAKAAAKRKELRAGLDLKTSQGLSKLAKYYQSIGELAEAAKIATAASEVGLREQQQKGFILEQTNLADRAKKLNLDDFIPRINATTDPKALEAIAKELRGVEISRLPALSRENRQKIASKQFNVSPSDFTALGLDEASDDDFWKILETGEGELSAWMKSDGSTEVYSERGGLLFDKESNSWKPPSYFNLVSEAPELTKVLNSDDLIREQLAIADVENLNELREKASEAHRLIPLIDRQLERVVDMPTGKFGEAELFTKQVANALGIAWDPEGVVSAEEFLSEAGTLVANQIKAFGSGSGLSDADREYSKLISAADITLKAEALQRLLKIQKVTYLATRNTYNKALDRLFTGEEGEKRKQAGSATFYKLGEETPSANTPEGQAILDSIYGQE